MSEEKPNIPPPPPPNQDKTVDKPSAPNNVPITHDEKPASPPNQQITEGDD